MTNKKKRLFAVALVIWILGLIYLGSKTLEEFRSGKKPFSGIDDTLTLKNIVFPSLKSRDQE
jgi:hypothetical protein